MEPPSADVRVFYAEVGEIDADATRELLAVEDLDGLAATAHPRRRAEYLAGRALLRFALQCCTGRPGSSYRLRIGSHGKPECVDGPSFSLSHSAGVAVCAISPAGAIGVDVQFPSARRRTREIAREYFSARDNDWLRRQPIDSFYMLWVLKEAHLKALGLGVGGGLDTLECRVAPPVIDARVAYGLLPTLALCGLGEAFLGVATTGYRFSAVAVEPWSACAAQRDVRLIARSA